MNAQEWKALKSEIAALADNHRRVATSAAEMIRAIENSYCLEVETFLGRLGGPFRSYSQVGNAIAHLSTYMRWFRWSGWNTAELCVLISGDGGRHSRRMGIAMLAYAGGRLVDDGIDEHLLFKGCEKTFVGFLCAEQPEISRSTACALSTYVGLCALQFAIQRARIIKEDQLSTVLETTFAAVLPGGFAEPCIQGPTDRRLYELIVRKKAVAYNMILYRAFLVDVPPAQRFRILRVLFPMDELAQLINDYSDILEDRTRKQFNAFTHGAYAMDEFLKVGRQKVLCLWQRVRKMLPLESQALAAMLNNLQLTTLDDAQIKPAAAQCITFSQQLLRAIRSGLRYLIGAQKLTGEYAAYYSVCPDMSSPQYKESPFFTAMILLALREIGDHAVELIIRRALPYLAGKRKVTGYVAYFDEGICDDLDDTCLINWLLQYHRYDAFDYHELARRISQLPRRGGLFRTWIGRSHNEPNEIDPCVSVNILRFLWPNRFELPETTFALRGELRKPCAVCGTVYYRTRLALPYLVGTLEYDLRERIMPKVLRAVACEGALRRSLGEGPERFCDVATGIFLSTQLEMDASLVREAVRWLLVTQRSDGSWPACSIFQAYNFWGSPEVSTALAVQALVAISGR